MAHPSYIAAAEQENRKPVVFMAIDGSEAGAQYYTTQSDWQGSDSLVNVSTVAEPGSVVSVFDFAPASNVLYSATGFPYFIRSLGVSGLLFAASGFQDYVEGTLPPIGTQVNVFFSYNLRFTLDDGVLVNSTTQQSFVSQIEGEITSHPSATRANWSCSGAKSNANPIPSFFTESGAAITVGTLINTEDPVSFIVVGYPSALTGQVTGSNISIDFIPSVTSATPENGANCQVETSAIDMGAVLTGTPILSIDDISETGASIAYTYEYSNDDISYTSGGTVVDGAQVTPARYYKITGLFSSTDGDISRIREYRISEGVFKYFGTHIDEPFQGISPYIVPKSVSTLNQKIQLDKGLSSTGESTIKLFWTEETSDMIAAGYLRGKDVTIYSGFEGIPEEAYEQVITGTWYDHDLDEVGRKISVKIRDALKQLSSKRKLPEEVVNNSTGAITTPAITYDTENLITAILDVFDRVGLRDRYIHPDWSTLETEYDINKYNVSRTISKPTDVNKLVDQLCTSGSLFVIPLGNGQLKPKPFNVNQDHIATLDADSVDFSGLKANLKDFFSRFYAYYNPNEADPTSTDQFDNGYGEIDATAELKWFPEKGTKQYLDLWKVGRTTAATPLTTPPQALIDLMKQWRSLFVEPLYTVNVNNLPPRFANIEPADVVEVNGLDLPVVNNEWAGGATYDNISKDVSAIVTSGRSMWFGDGGYKMFVASLTTMFEYDLTEPYDIDSAVYSGNSLSLSPATGVGGCFFRTDGTKFYVSSSTTIYQFSMPTPWSLVGASYDSISFASGLNLQDLHFKFDGTKMYLLSSVTGLTYQYSVPTAWNVSTAVSDSVTFSIATEAPQASGLFFNDDGFRMFIVNAVNPNEYVFQYNLDVAWDLNTVNYSDISTYIGGETNSPRKIYFNPDGITFYIIDGVSIIYQYSVQSPYDIGGKTYAAGDRAIHDGIMWRSRVGDNLNNDPTSEPAFWQDINIDADGKTNAKHFFVIGRTFNPNDATIDLNLMEMPPATLGAFDAGAFSSAFNQ